MSVVYELVQNALSSRAPSLDGYLRCLRESFLVHEPEHGKATYGKRYRELVKNPDWFAESLVMNAEREGFGSRQIWQFSQLVEDDLTRGLIQSHSIDESRHSRTFVRIIELLFGSSLDNAMKLELMQLSPGYTPLRHPENSQPVRLPHEKTIDELIQINLVEIRSLVLQLLLRPAVLARAENRDLPKLTRILDVLFNDECRHIGYSAECIERSHSAGNHEFVRETMIRRAHDLNAITLQELSTKDFE